MPAVSDIQVSKVSVFVLRFFFFFSHKHKNYSNSGMHTLIELKFGTRVGQPKVNISTKFGAYRSKNFVIISDNFRKQLLTGLQGKLLTGMN